MILLIQITYLEKNIAVHVVNNIFFHCTRLGFLMIEYYSNGISIK